LKDCRRGFISIPVLNKTTLGASWASYGLSRTEHIVFCLKKGIPQLPKAKKADKFDSELVLWRNYEKNLEVREWKDHEFGKLGSVVYEAAYLLHYGSVS